MKFYHYTSMQTVQNIRSGRNFGKVLMPMEPFISEEFIKGLPDAARRKAIFGLLNPKDPAWCKKGPVYDEEPLLQTILDDVAVKGGGNNHICRLEINLQPTDDACVADWSPHFDDYYAYMCLGIVPYDEEYVREVQTEYFKSLIPITEYKRRHLNYTVPEVVCFSPIPLDRIRVFEVGNPFYLVNQIRELGGFEKLPRSPKFNRKAEPVLAS